MGGSFGASFGASLAGAGCFGGGLLSAAPSRAQLAAITMASNEPARRRDMMAARSRALVLLVLCGELGIGMALDDYLVEERLDTTIEVAAPVRVILHARRVTEVLGITCRKELRLRHRGVLVVG